MAKMWGNLALSRINVFSRRWRRWRRKQKTDGKGRIIELIKICVIRVISGK